MPILNYTTTVAVGRTVDQVHSLLVRAGARQIMTEWGDNAEVTRLAFAVPTPHGLRRFFLPINADRVEAVLDRDPNVPRRYTGAAQAERVAWRIVKDWLEAQIAIIETEMVTLDQVMLPYMVDDQGRTTYELYLEQQLALPPAEVR